MKLRTAFPPERYDFASVTTLRLPTPRRTAIGHYASRASEAPSLQRLRADWSATLVGTTPFISPVPPGREDVRTESLDGRFLSVHIKTIAQEKGAAWVALAHTTKTPFLAARCTPSAAKAIRAFRSATWRTRLASRWAASTTVSATKPVCSTQPSRTTTGLFCSAGSSAMRRQNPDFAVFATCFFRCSTNPAEHPSAA